MANEYECLFKMLSRPPWAGIPDAASAICHMEKCRAVAGCERRQQPSNFVRHKDCCCSKCCKCQMAKKNFFPTNYEKQLISI